MIPLTVPEVRRLLRLLVIPPAQQAFHLQWSWWRRSHQAAARRSHITRRARAPVLAAPSVNAPASAAVPTPRPTATTRPLATLTDAQWTRVQPLLPVPVGIGRPPHDARLVLAGIHWVQQRHAAWRDLPAAFGPWPTIYGRYRQWCRSALWPRLATALQDSTTL
ncbi:MAG: transposase [Chloroflexota bacterium]|nr:transposase [Chloroflexota bacterium]